MNQNIIIEEVNIEPKREIISQFVNNLDTLSYLNLKFVYAKKHHVPL